MKIKVSKFELKHRQYIYIYKNCFIHSLDTPDNSDSEINANNANSSDDQWEEDYSEEEEENDDEKLNGEMDASD